MRVLVVELDPPDLKDDACVLDAPEPVAYMERKQAEVMSCREAPRCLKRMIARAVLKTMPRTERAALGTVAQADFGVAPVAVYSRHRSNS